MAQVPLAPPPQEYEPRWMWLLWKRINDLASAAWAAIDFTGSNLTDIATRNHNDLQNKQGGTGGEYYHMTAAEYAAKGTVTSVAVSGANGIGVSGSPVTSSGTIGLSLGDITPTSVNTGTITSSDNLLLPATTVATGIIKSGANSFLHAYGTENTFLGINAGNLTTTGSTNTVIGANAAPNVTTSSSLVAIGRNALFSNTTGGRNTAVGVNAMYYMFSGTNNVAIGTDALYAGDLSGGPSNMVAIGAGSMSNVHSTALEDVAIGDRALFTLSSGSYNTAVGVLALYQMTTGSYNTAIGRNAVPAVATSIANTGVGVNALRDTTGGYNTAVGFVAGVTNTTGTNNTSVGAGADTSATGLTYASAFGSDAVVGSSSTVVIGRAGDVLVTGGTATRTLGNANRIQVQGTTAATNSLGISAWSADALGSRIELGKSRGATIGTNTIVQNNDVVASITGYGANGTTFTNLASISMEVDGTPGATNDMPGRIVFSTTPNGSGTLTEAMRLSQDQTALFASSVQTAAPTTGTAAPWKLGTLVTGQIGLVVLSTQYLEVDVNGSLIKLATI